MFVQETRRTKLQRKVEDERKKDEPGGTTKDRQHVLDRFR